MKLFYFKLKSLFTKKKSSFTDYEHAANKSLQKKQKKLDRLILNSKKKSPPLKHDSNKKSSFEFHTRD